MPHPLTSNHVSFSRATTTRAVVQGYTSLITALRATIKSCSFVRVSRWTKKRTCCYPDKWEAEKSNILASSCMKKNIEKRMAESDEDDWSSSSGLTRSKAIYSMNWKRQPSLERQRTRLSKRDPLLLNIRYRSLVRAFEQWLVALLLVDFSIVVLDREYPVLRHRIEMSHPKPIGIDWPVPSIYQNTSLRTSRSIARRPKWISSRSSCSDIRHILSNVPFDVHLRRHRERVTLLPSCAVVEWAWGEEWAVSSECAWLTVELGTERKSGIRSPLYM